MHRKKIFQKEEKENLELVLTWQKRPVLQRELEVCIHSLLLAISMYATST